MGHIIKLTRNRYFSVFPSKALPVPCHPSFMLSLETQHWSRLWPRGCLGVFVFPSLLPGSVDLRVKNIKALLVTLLQLQKYPESSHTAILWGELCLIQWHCNLTRFFISKVFKIKLQGHIAFQCFPNKFFYTIFLKLLFMLTDCMLSGINNNQSILFSSFSFESSLFCNLFYRSTFTHFLTTVIFLCRPTFLYHFLK